MKSKNFWAAALQIIGVFGVLLIVACVPPGALNSPSTGDSGGETDSRARTGECEKDKDCQKMCKDIYKSRKDRSKCEEFAISEVEKIKKVFDVLEDPDTDDLEEMDLSDLRFLLDISSEPLESLAGGMNPGEHKSFLAWLASNSEAADIIKDKEDEYKILKKLLGSSEGAVIAALNKTIDSGDTFTEVALEGGNDVVLDWLHDFFGDNCGSESEYEKCIFTRYYCKLKLTGDLEETYLEQNFFESMLDDILAESRPSWGDIIPDCKSDTDCWWEKDGGTETGDLDKWKSSPHNVCGSLGVS